MEVEIPMLERKDLSDEFDALVNRALGDFPFLSELPFPRVAPFTPGPPLDVYENDGKYAIDLSVPGYDAKDVNIEVNGSTVTISGSRKQSDEKKTARYYRREMRSGSFERSVTLPQELDSEHVDAKLQNGLLTIELAPLKPIAAKKIAIKS